jgi:hypothetical protein
MPTSILKKLAPFEGVSPGEKATLDLVIGPRYQNIILEGTVTPDAGETATIAHIMGLINIMVNGKSQRQFTATELSELNPLNGAEFDVETENITNPGNPLGNGDEARFRVTLLFGEPFRKSYAADKVMSWPTTWPGNVNLGTFQIEVAIPDVAGATGHDLKAYGEFDGQLGVLDAGGKPIFNISKWWRQTVIYTGAGDRYITTLPKRDQYQSMHFFSQSGDPISHIKITRDGTVLYDLDKTINDNNLVNHGINPLALSDDRFDILFDRDDLPDSALVMNGVSEFEVILTIDNGAAANKSITLITQVYGPRD